jgi:hypothetical protein
MKRKFIPLLQLIERLEDTHALTSDLLKLISSNKEINLDHQSCIYIGRKAYEISEDWLVPIEKSIIKEKKEIEIYIAKRLVDENDKSKVEYIYAYTTPITEKCYKAKLVIESELFNSATLIRDNIITKDNFEDYYNEWFHGTDNETNFSCFIRKKLGIKKQTEF